MPETRVSAGSAVVAARCTGYSRPVNTAVMSNCKIKVTSATEESNIDSENSQFQMVTRVRVNAR